LCTAALQHILENPKQSIEHMMEIIDSDQDGDVQRNELVTKFTRGIRAELKEPLEALYPIVEEHVEHFIGKILEKLEKKKEKPGDREECCLVM
tara:strand:- start:141 stop:419 length:279 start_codon:yes stop_codon:yes gene_type:complete